MRREKIRLSVKEKRITVSSLQVRMASQPMMVVAKMAQLQKMRRVFSLRGST